MQSNYASNEEAIAFLQEVRDTDGANLIQKTEVAD